MTAAKTGLWQPEEDALLAKWQAKVGNRWATIAKHIPGRTGQQCAQRWRHKVNPGIVHKPWTPEEDDLLASLVESEGQHWAAIARHLPGRTDQQCLGRWRRRIDPAICRGEWSAEEDALLLELHAQLGNSWSQIARCIAARTSQQCRGRYFQLEIKSGGAGPKSSGTRGRRVSRDSDDDYEDTDDDVGTPQPATDSSDYMPVTHIKPFKMKVYSSSLKKTAVPSPMPEGTPSSYSQGRKSIVNKHVVRRLAATQPVSGTTASERSDHTLLAQPMVMPMPIAMTPSTQACYAAVPIQAPPTAGNIPGPYMLPGILWQMPATDMTVKQTAPRSITRPPTSTKRAAIRHARCTLFKSIGCRSDSSPSEDLEEPEGPVEVEQQAPSTIKQDTPCTTAPPAPAPAQRMQNHGAGSVGAFKTPAPAPGHAPITGPMTGSQLGQRAAPMNSFATIVPALFAPLPMNHGLADLKSPSTPKHNIHFGGGTSSILPNVLDGTKPAGPTGLDGVDNSLPAWSCLEPPSIARSEIATPDSIVRMLKSPPGLRDMNHMASLPGLLFSPGCSKPHFPLHAAEAAALFNPTATATHNAGGAPQTLAAHTAAECITPACLGISSPKNGTGQQRSSLHAEAVAAGLMSPQATCISNWSAVPAVSWTSFQAARNELRELQQQFGGNMPGSAGPTPISNHTRSVLNEVADKDDKDASEHTGKHSVARTQLATMHNRPSVVCVSPRASKPHLQEGLGSVKAPGSVDRLNRPALNEMEHSSSVITATRKKLIAQLEDYGSVSKPEAAADENMAPVKLSDVQRALFTSNVQAPHPKSDFVGIAGLLVTNGAGRDDKARQQGFASTHNGNGKLSSSLPTALSHMAQTPQSNRMTCNNTAVLGVPKISAPVASVGAHAPLFQPQNIHAGFAIATQATDARAVGTAPAVGTGVSSPFATNHSQSSPRHVFHSPSNNFTAGPGAKISKLKSSSPSKKLRIAVAEAGSTQKGGSPLPSARGYAVIGRVRSYESLGDAVHATPSSPAGRSHPATSDDEGMDAGHSAAHPAPQQGCHTTTSVWRGVAGYLGFGAGRGQGQSLLAAFKGAVNNTSTTNQPTAPKSQQAQGHGRPLDGSSPAKTSMKSPRTMLGRMMSPSASSKHRAPKESSRVDARPIATAIHPTEPVVQQAAGASSKPPHNTGGSRSVECLKSVAAAAAEQRLPIERAKSNLSMQLQSRPSATTAAILSLACTSTQSAGGPIQSAPPSTGQATEPQPTAMSCTPFEALQLGSGCTSQQFMLSRPADQQFPGCNPNAASTLPMQNSHNSSSVCAADDCKAMEQPASATSLSCSVKQGLEGDSAQQLAAEFMSDELCKIKPVTGAARTPRIPAGEETDMKQLQYTDMELGTAEDLGFALGTCDMCDPDGQQ